MGERKRETVKERERERERGVREREKDEESMRIGKEKKSLKNRCAKNCMLTMNVNTLWYEICIHIGKYPI